MSKKSQRGRYLASLVKHGVLIPGNAKGVYGKNSDFEDLVVRLELLLTKLVPRKDVEYLRFPPVMDRSWLVAQGYLAKFPHLLGTIHAFSGSDSEHEELLRKVAAHKEWAHSQVPTELALVPAACLPVYPAIARRGPLSPRGVTIDVQSFCFRHEPSVDPMRMQSFRMREYIRMGSAHQTMRHVHSMMDKAKELMSALLLPYRSDTATDPFFGKRATLLSESQREQSLKSELSVPLFDNAAPVACASFNSHQTYFAEVWNIRTHTGELAHTACVGFGLERIVLALFCVHGFDHSRWNSKIRAALGMKS